MRFNVDVLQSELVDIGFRLFGKSAVERSARFCRKADQESLFLWIEVQLFGRSGDTGGASAGISVTRIVGLKGLTEIEPVREVAADLVRIWTEFQSNSEFEAWQRCVARVVPGKAEEMARSLGSELLLRTQEAREAASRILNRIGPSSDWQEQVSRIERTASPKLVAEMERLMAFPGVLQQWGADDIYRIACYGVVEEMGERAIGANPLKDTDVMWRIQLVADELMVRSMDAENSQV